MKRYENNDYYFVINRCKLDDRGEYIIKAENHYGFREEPVFLNVHCKFVIIIPLKQFFFFFKFEFQEKMHILAKMPILCTIIKYTKELKKIIIIYLTHENRNKIYFHSDELV